MGFFNFFKKKEEIREEVSLDGLEKWLKKRKEGLSNQEKEILDPISSLISELIIELKEEIIILENFDIEILKTEERIKLIIKEQLKNYIESLRKMMDKLEQVGGKEVILDINLILEDFRKKSHISYEKVTFLIGKEMRATKGSLNKFVKSLENILKSNKKFFDEYETINSIDLNLFNSIKEKRKKVYENLNNEINQEKKLEESLENKKREIEEIKVSKEYLLELKKQKDLDLNREELKEVFSKLRMKIDFKFLSNFYHKFEKDMALVKGFKDNFKESIETYGVNRLEELLKESKLFDDEILELIERIDLMKKGMKEVQIKDYGILFLKRDVERVKSEIETIQLEIKIKEKRVKTLDDEIDDTINLFREKLEGIGVDFIS
jgi:hypothetical protein